MWVAAVSRCTCWKGWKAVAAPHTSLVVHTFDCECMVCACGCPFCCRCCLPTLRAPSTASASWRTTTSTASSQGEFVCVWGGGVMASLIFSAFLHGKRVADQQACALLSASGAWSIAPRSQSVLLHVLLRGHLLRPPCCLEPCRSVSGLFPAVCVHLQSICICSLSASAVWLSV